MATYARIQAAVSKGYAKAAQVLGRPNDHYRPADPLAPIDPTSLLGPLPAFFATEPNLKLVRPGAYKDAIRFGSFDYTQTQPGDYLVGPDGLTHFIAAMEPLLVAECVECNRVLSFERQSTDPEAGTASGGGVRAYGNRTPGPVPIPVLPGDTLLTGWPASCLLGTKGESAPSSGRLPDDTRAPWWSIKMPALAGGPILNVTDIATDEIGRRYIVSAAELTARGWNITAQQAVV